MLYLYVRYCCAVLCYGYKLLLGTLSVILNVQFLLTHWHTTCYNTWRTYKY